MSPSPLTYAGQPTTYEFNQPFTVEEEQSSPAETAKSEVNHDTLKKAIADACNRVCRENISNTPDFILAEYVLDSLASFEKASLAREKWYGKSLTIGGNCCCGN